MVVVAARKITVVTGIVGGTDNNQLNGGSGRKDGCGNVSGEGGAEHDGMMGRGGSDGGSRRGGRWAGRAAAVQCNCFSPIFFLTVTSPPLKAKLMVLIAVIDAPLSASASLLLLSLLGAKLIKI